MFGITKIHPTATLDERRQFRLHYCGTCKSIARNFGHKSRFFTNYDTAFLAELLNHLKNQNNWEKHFESYNCFDIPAKIEIPKHLEYTACISVLLADLKLADNLIDSKQKVFLWKVVSHLFSKEFSRAERQLSKWGIPTKEIWKLFFKQVEREKINTNYQDSLQQLYFYAEATSELTGLVFKYGAIHIETFENQNELYKLGYHFGRIAYLLDALEDFEKDLRDKNFNAIQSAFQTNELTKEIREKVTTLINASTNNIKDKLLNLGLNPIISEGLSLRISENIDKRLKLNFSSPKQELSKPIVQINLKTKLRRAFNLSQSISIKKKSKNNFLNKAQLHLNTLFLFILFTILPYRVWAQNSSSGEGGGCLLLCILMALCGGKKYVVEENCWGQKTVREKTCCD